jgi:hypothetical protein
MDTYRPPAGFLARHRFGLLFAALLLFFALTPLAHQVWGEPDPAQPYLLDGLLFFLVLAAVVVSVSQRRRQTLVALGLGLPAALLGLLHLLVASDLVAVAHHAFAGTFLAYAIGVILRFLFASPRVTLDTLFASLCVYLLLGVAWALAYSAVDIFDPGAFAAAQQAGASAPVLTIGRGGKVTVLYFSFTTLTTLGYGDIVPRSPVARMLTSVEAITGQLYLTVLVARLVGLHLTESLSMGQALESSDPAENTPGRQPDGGGDGAALWRERRRE